MQVDIGKDTLYKVRPLKILFNMNHPDYWVGPFFFKVCHYYSSLSYGTPAFIRNTKGYFSDKSPGC